MRNSFVLGALFLSIICPLFGEEDFSIDEYYRHFVQESETGVYTKNDYIVFHVKNKIDPNNNLSRTKDKRTALFDATNLVRKWCINYSINNAPKEIGADNYAFVVSILGAYWPEWRYSEWELKNSSMRILADKKIDKYYITSWVFKKSDLIESLPPTFTSKPSKEFMLSSLKKIATKELDKDANDFYKFCGAIDFAREHKTTNSKINEEYNELSKEIDKYYKDSKYIKYLKKQQELIAQSSHNKEITFLVNEAISPDIIKNEVVTTNVVTNVKPVISTNVVMKAYDDGLSAKYLEYTKRIPAVVEIVETKTIKVAYFKEEAENKPVNEFEEIIFSRGETVGKATPQTEFAKTAISAFSSKEVSIEEKQKALESALRENPGDADLWNFYGRFLFLQENYYQALISFRIAIKLNPKHEYALTNLVLVYTELGKIELAKGVFPIAWCYSNSDWTKAELSKVLNKF